MKTAVTEANVSNDLAVGVDRPKDRRAVDSRVLIDSERKDSASRRVKSCCVV